MTPPRPQTPAPPDMRTDAELRARWSELHREGNASRTSEEGEAILAQMDDIACTLERRRLYAPTPAAPRPEAGEPNPVRDDSLPCALCTTPRDHHVYSVEQFGIHKWTPNVVRLRNTARFLHSLADKLTYRFNDETREQIRREAEYLESLAGYRAARRADPAEGQ